MDWVDIALTVENTYAETVMAIFHESIPGGIVIEELSHETRENDIERDRYQRNGKITPCVNSRQERITIRGYLPNDGKFSVIIGELKSSLQRVFGEKMDIESCLDLKEVQEDDWAHSWKKFYKPFNIGRKLFIKPIWEEVIEPEDRVIVEVDPGMAFGTGTHPTTCMCLRALEINIVGGEKILDLGTGSGILAVAAAKLGADSVLAVDCDSIAVTIARENAYSNGVEGIVTVREGELATVIAEGFDIVIANINKATLLPLIELFPAYLQKAGLLILSGIMVEHQGLFMRQLTGKGLKIKTVEIDAGWVAFTAVFI